VTSKQVTQWVHRAENELRRMLRHCKKSWKDRLHEQMQMLSRKERAEIRKVTHNRTFLVGFAATFKV